MPRSCYIGSIQSRHSTFDCFLGLQQAADSYSLCSKVQLTQTLAFQFDIMIESGNPRQFQTVFQCWLNRRFNFNLRKLTLYIYNGIFFSK